MVISPECISILNGISEGSEYETSALMPSSASTALTWPTCWLADPSLTTNSYGRSINSGFLSLISLTRILTVAVLDKPPSSSALIILKKIETNFIFKLIRC